MSAKPRQGEAPSAVAERSRAAHERPAVAAPGRNGRPKGQAALNEAWRMMHFALRAVINEPDRILATRGLTRVHHRILFFVAHTPGMSVGELQATLAVTKQALNAPLRQLQTQGLIELAKADRDARVREIRLTADGIALEAKLTGEQQRLFAEAFAKAGAQAHEGWRRVMMELARHAGMS